MCLVARASGLVVILFLRETPLRTFGTLGCIVAFAAVLPLRAADGYSVKAVDKTPAPAELQEPIRKLMGERCVQLLDAKGEILAEVWFRKDVPAKATDAQIKNGLTFREIAETTLFGAIRFPKQYTDYRKQKIQPGVYTLRLANQPMDGDHMGTAPFSEFLLLSPAAEDKKPDTMEPKAASGIERQDHERPSGSHAALLR